MGEECLGCGYVWGHRLSQSAWEAHLAECPYYSTRWQHECYFCFAPVGPLEKVPSVDDDPAWERLGTAHASWCEWIETRAHRINPWPAHTSQA